MELNEAASLLCISKERARLAIQEGIETPISRRRIRLAATMLQHGYDISQEDLDAFIAAFEAEEPGRHPPVAIRRLLLIEAGYRCAVCRDSSPLQFHHIIEWSSIKHHDAEHMLAVCGNCHGKITRHGEPDITAQKEIKRRLRERADAHLIVAGRVEVAPPASAQLPRPYLSQPTTQPNSSPDVFGGERASAAAVETPRRLASKSQATTLRRIFTDELEFEGATEEAMDDVAASLFSDVTWIADFTIRSRTLLLRTLRAIMQIQRLRSPSGSWTDWTNTDRLADAFANVLASLDVDLGAVSSRADAAIRDAREKKFLQFRDEDEWRPGMASGSGWVEKVTLSLIGEKFLEKTDAHDPSMNQRSAASAKVPSDDDIPF